MTSVAARLRRALDRTVRVEGGYDNQASNQDGETRRIQEEANGQA